MHFERDSEQKTTFIIGSDHAETQSRAKRGACERGIPDGSRHPVASARVEDVAAYWIHDDGTLHLVVASVDMHTEHDDARFEDAHDRGYEWTVWDGSNGRYACGIAIGDEHYFVTGTATKQLELAMTEFGWRNFPQAWESICAAAFEKGIVLPAGPIMGM